MFALHSNLRYKIYFRVTTLLLAFFVILTSFTTVSAQETVSSFPNDTDTLNENVDTLTVNPDIPVMSNDTNINEKNDSTTTTVYPSMFYNTDGTTSTKHIFANGNEIGTVTGTGNGAVVKYIQTDHLGSTNVKTDSAGNVVETLDYYPYGATRLDEGNAKEQRQYIGQEYDADTGLSYLNARYYDSKEGRFVSEDPQFWSFEQSYLLDPQNQNSYSYARDNPVNLSDPSGLLTIIIPGTGYSRKDWSSTGSASNFISAVGKTFNETPEVLNWSGGDNRYARQQAANNAINIINNHDFTEGEKLNIVGHSHGGNIGILISQETSRKIDNLITLGTPVESDYQPDYSMIDNHINVYSTADGIQTAGGNQIRVSGIAGGVIGALTCGPVCALTGLFVGNAIGWGEVGPAGRTFSGARNISIQGGGSLVGAHSSLWSNPNVWSTLSKQIK